LEATDGAAGWAGRFAELLRAHAAHDVDRARVAGEAAIDRGADDDVGRALALHLLGVSELAGGVAEVAGDRLEEAAALATGPGRERLRMECLGPVAAVEVVRGRLSRAEGHARAALDLANRHGWEHAPAAGWALAALAAIAWLRGESAAADRRAASAVQAASTGRDALLGDVLRALRAHVRAAERDVDSARTLLRLVRDTPPPPGGMLARWLEALGPTPWAPSTGEGPADATSRAVRLLRSGDTAKALRVVVALDQLPDMHPTVRIGSLLVEAVARETLGEPGTAAALERALQLAEPDRIRRPFLSGGAPLREVMRCHASLAEAGAPLLAELLDALPSASEDAAAGLAEPLSERERAVLRLMPTILANSEIAGELFVSVNTVKTHVRSIYRKLDVGSRRDAVARARQVGLL
jgi:LuxR family maltose regulon positive regulatory protein